MQCGTYAVKKVHCIRTAAKRGAAATPHCDSGHHWALTAHRHVSKALALMCHVLCGLTTWLEQGLLESSLSSSSRACFCSLFPCLLPLPIAGFSSRGKEGRDKWQWHPGSGRKQRLLIPSFPLMLNREESEKAGKEKTAAASPLGFWVCLKAQTPGRPLATHNELTTCGTQLKGCATALPPLLWICPCSEC